MKTIPHLYLLLLAVLPAFLLSSLLVAAKPGEDLYAVLGVPKTASPKEIKSAYRRQARDTHPDKNRDVPAEEAAAAFHRVVHAFETLSDAASRRRYDVHGDDAAAAGDGPSRRQESWSAQFFRRARTVRLKDRFEVKQAQSRVLHVVSLDQLRTIMLDDRDRLERHLLLCFFTPQVERVVNDEIVYPYPFAGMSTQSIWWEDILQTASVRFYRSSELTRYFNIGHGDAMTEPTFVFARKGAMLGDSLARDDPDVFFHSTKDRQSFDKWMWDRVEVQVVFHNRHDHPVQLYWMSGNRAHLKEVLAPGTSWTHYSRLTHEFWARDARVDAWGGSPGTWKLTPNSGLGSWQIGVEGPGGAPARDDGSVHVDIRPQSCFDLSGHCAFWSGRNQCSENPSFMREKCMLTCGHCSKVEEDQTCET